MSAEFFVRNAEFQNVLFMLAGSIYEMKKMHNLAIELHREILILCG